MKKDLLSFIDIIISKDLFWEANYYYRCMKKLPHGGIAHFTYPNVYLLHYPTDTTILFRQNSSQIPYFLEKLVDELYKEYFNFMIDIEELCRFCFEDDRFWYVGYQILKPKKNFMELNKERPIFMEVISSNLMFQDYFEIDYKIIIYVLVCFLIKDNHIIINGIPDIIKHERLLKSHNKYGLSLVNNARFLRQGFILDGGYYLYNIFLDTSIGPPPIAEMPHALHIIQEEVHDMNLYMRCDEKLSVPVDKMISTATIDLQKYRGITLKLIDIEKVIKKKEIIVHYDEERLDKVIMLIKPDIDKNGLKFFHIEVEELWNPEKIRDWFVITNYIHAQYYPSNRSFNHIDFSVNQYPYVLG